MDEMKMNEELLAMSEPEDINSDKFVIDSMKKGDWAMGKIKVERARIAENEELVQTRILELQEWLKKQNEASEGSIAFFESLLAPFVQEQIKGSKKKSINLPNGTVGFKKTTKTTKDDAAILTFVKDNCSEYIKLKETVDMAEFKKACKVVDGKLITSEGEVVPGYEVEETNVLYTKVG